MIIPVISPAEPVSNAASFRATAIAAHNSCTLASSDMVTGGCRQRTYKKSASIQKRYAQRVIATSLEQHVPGAQLQQSVSRDISPYASDSKLWLLQNDGDTSLPSPWTPNFAVVHVP